ncbi:hypothetical protein K458DRAFT_391210 [Lentithecium fluviatile CBS 122367]|uniref:Uncharacterized protein n=1 Tax=Lentithecium fluviatile CBS 122367 TaxID=1168545 RepID=A0A6G1IW71_9PLEO|nr:hypothetical protein K458DRAFT_391210 [Lentithecium fluviatile CBS 122367]
MNQNPPAQPILCNLHSQPWDCAQSPTVTIYRVLRENTSSFTHTSKRINATYTASLLATGHRYPNNFDMCYFERVHYTFCGHDEKGRLIQHCHFARNDPAHQCFGAWNYRGTLEQHNSECKDCAAKKQMLGTNGLASVRTMYGIANGR